MARLQETIVTLSVGQAAGTTPVLPLSPYRKMLVIVPPADCQLTVTSGVAIGFKLFANLPNTFSDTECPANDLYIYGLTVGNLVTIWEG